MKAASFVAIVALAGSAFAGSSQREPSYESQEANVGWPSARFQNAGTPGAYYRSNFMRNAVFLRNDTENYVTFFVYFRDVDGPNDVNRMIREGAYVVERVVPPRQEAFMNQSSWYYCVGSKVGKWSVGNGGIVPQQF